MHESLTAAQQRYLQYLQSPHWQQVRNRILHRARQHCEVCGYFCGPVEMLDEREASARIQDLIDDGVERCAVCGFYCHIRSTEDNSGRVWLEVHHRTYERVGREDDNDLIAMCCYCHEEVTGREQLRASVRRNLAPDLPKDATHTEVIAAMAAYWLSKNERESW